LQGEYNDIDCIYRNLMLTKFLALGVLFEDNNTLY